MGVSLQISGVTGDSNGRKGGWSDVVAGVMVSVVAGMFR